MKMDNQHEKRKHSRLKVYDYTNSGCYFITFCTKDRAHVLSRIVGRGTPEWLLLPIGNSPSALPPPQVELTNIGKIAAEVIERTSAVYPGISIDNYVIMPNHVHLLIRISPVDGGVRAPRPTDNRSVSVTGVIKAIKSITTRKIGTKIWQTSFYDHVIRDDEDYQIRFRYIEENPAKWQQDKYYYQEV